MSEAYDRIKEGLNEARAFARGEKTGAIVHHISVPTADNAATGTLAAKKRPSTPKANGPIPKPQ